MLGHNNPPLLLELSKTESEILRDNLKEQLKNKDQQWRKAMSCPTKDLNGKNRALITAALLTDKLTIQDILGKIEEYIKE